MVTIILGLSALSIVLGYMVRSKNKEIYRLENRENKIIEIWEKRYNDYVNKHKSQKQNWRQTTNNWILEKEQHIEKLEQENFNQLHELALMLNDSYHVDEIILSKAEKFDRLVNRATRERKRNFIKGRKVEEV